MSALRDALRNLPDAVFADVLESDDAYLFVLDLPGVRAEDAEVDVEDGVLRVDARRAKAVPDGFRYRSEERSLFLDAAIPLPPDARDDGEASVERGVLEVRVPKRGRGREVPVED